MVALQMPPKPSENASRRGCTIFGGAMGLILLLLIAVSLGWVGQVDRGKVTDLPVAAGNG